MKHFNTFNQFYNKYLALIVVGVAAAALLLPQTFLWASSYTTLFLQVVMFTMGLTMKPVDFTAVFKKPWLMALVTFLQFTFMPLSALLLAKLFQLPDEIALGLILVGCVPGGTSSNVITYLANGDVPLSVAATSISTLLAPLLTPLFLSLYGGAYLEISFWSMFLSILQVVLVPIVGGLIFRYFFGTRVEKIETALPSLSATAVLLVLGGTVSVNSDTLLGTGMIMFLIVWLHNLSGYAMGYAACKLFKIKLSSTRAIAVEVGLQNTGLAGSLGLAYFSPATALAGAAGTIVHTLFGTIFASICSYKDLKEKEASAAAVTELL
ncbi:bile acid:sodium symporter family protein [Desemzia sp. RIT804]|uniref:bile acid:sodium symporter family protein n=1 Tax=Desemzia sp. RIT 804 TaxID=2810209 RepID=UPI0019506736|nr:bile acid:sodium symporter family protein [Desemzia sp. RIT 804]MBM6615165.1 bile acid:sodium symporter family protein [Desemzia sp. RIT 804]